MSLSFESKLNSAVKSTQGGARDLFCFHSIGYHDLMKVAKRGALTAPSIAITTSEADFRTYGEILLVLSPSVLMAGKSKVPNSNSESMIFTGDYYSMATPDQRVVLDGKALSSFSDRVNVHGGEPGLSIMYVTKKHDRSLTELFSEFQRSDTLKRLFIEDSGLTVIPPTKLKKLDANSFSAMGVKELGLAKFSKLLARVKTEPEAVLEFKRVMELSLRELYAVPNPDPDHLEVVEELVSEKLDTLDYEILSIASTAQDELAAIKLKERVIDKDKYVIRLEAAFKKAGGRYEFDTWARRTIDGMTSKTYFMGDDGQKFNSYEAVDKYMRSQRGQGMEKTASISVGELKSVKTSRINSLGELVELKGLIEPNQELRNDVELDRALVDFKDSLHEFIPAEIKSGLCELETLFVGQCARTAVNSGDSMSAIASKLCINPNTTNYEKLSDSVAKLRCEYQNSKDLVPYFEAVEFGNPELNKDNVMMVVVPREMKKCIQDLFDDNGITGLKVRGYDRKMKGTQMTAVPPNASVENHAAKLEKTLSRKKAASLSF